MVKAYKANVRVRWVNRITRQRVDLAPGMVVTFEDGDFNAPGGPVTAALSSLDDVLARGLFAAFDPAKAGDPEYMSRDELLHLARAYGLGEFEHDTPIDTLRPVVDEYLQNLRREADAAREPAPRTRKRGEE